MNFTDEKIEQYAIQKSRRPSPYCESLELHTRKIEPMARMLIGPLEASFLGILLRSLKAKRVLEIGTFTGYSALAMAEHLPDDGEVHTIDIEAKDYTLGFWAASPHGKKSIPTLVPA